MNYRLSRCPLTFCASLLSPGDGCDRAATEGVKGSREEAPGSRDLGGRRMGRRWPKKGALDAWLGAEDAPLGSFAATPRGTSSAKGEYRKDSGLPGSGCSIARNPLSQPPRHALLPGGEDAAPLRRAQPSSARGSRKRAAPTGAPPASPPRPLLAGGPLPPRGAGSAPAGMGGPSAVTSYLVAVCQDSNPRYTLNPPSVPAAVATRHSCLTLSGPKR